MTPLHDATPAVELGVRLRRCWVQVFISMAMCPATKA